MNAGLHEGGVSGIEHGVYANWIDIRRVAEGANGCLGHGVTHNVDSDGL